MKDRTLSYRLLPLAAGLPVAALVSLAGAAPPRPTAKPAASKPVVSQETRFAREVAPLVAKYCVGCHSPQSAAGGIDLTDKTLAGVLKHRAAWEKAAANTAAHNMPPREMPQPTQSERDRISGFVESVISQADCQLNDPGRVTMRRLNRAEYNNTVRDLLGVDLRLADSFPSDDVGYGFDNIGDVLSLSPLLMEKYVSAADKAARAAIVAPELAPRPFKATGTQLSGDGSDLDSARLISSVGEARTTYDFRGSGEYTILVAAWGQQAGPENAKMEVRIDGKKVAEFDVAARDSRPETYRATVKIDTPGKRAVGVAFINDFYQEKPKIQDRNLVVESVEIKQPTTLAQIQPDSHRRLIVARPTENSDAAWDKAARQVLTPFLSRAFRRPATGDEVARLVKVTHLARANKQSFERGIQLAVQAALVSPHFLFRVETDAQPNNPKARRALNDYELANRLSYFLWSSMPDAELLKVAGAGTLHNPDVLAAQATRMLKDPKARALAENFAGQWLQLRKLTVIQPDTSLFPEFQPALRAAMKTETETFFTNVVREDRPVLEFLSANYTYLNETLAKHYGIPGVTGDTFRKVVLPDKRRGGLLMQASVLTVTSNPTRTSPVKRGKWVMENLLGTPPPPPPPNVPPLEEVKGGPIKAATVRERLEIHRKNPACASCHARLDGIGFALENFDAVGKWRKDEFGKPLDTSGNLPDGSTFDGPEQLRGLLMTKKQMFTRTISERLMTYALGRGIESTDKCNIDEVAATVAKGGYKFSALVRAVVTSQPFRERRGDGDLRKTASR
jgi:mono/diheme cytochrome c family protein